eukprot:scaffold6430_cov133-Isochrysis_galbana.AAC.8
MARFASSCVIGVVGFFFGRFDWGVGRRELWREREKKIFRRKRYSLAATWLGSSALLPSGHSLSPPPFFLHPFFLVQAAISGGWCQSCVHYNSLGSSIESLGFIVVLKPMSASNSTSHRADYG